MPFSEKLKKLREENHYTQKYVANISMLHVLPLPGMKQKNRQPSHEKTDDSC